MSMQLKQVIQTLESVSFFMEKYMYQSENPSSIRSKKLLTEALFDLMKVKTYNQITITELVNAADLTRKTFYRNFSSKDDILENYMDDIFKEYVDSLERLECFESSAIINTYFKICKKNQKFLTLIMEQNLLFLLHSKYLTYLSAINEKFQKKSISESSVTQYHIAFSAGGFLQILYLWLKNGLKETPEEMAEICVRFLQNS